MINIQSIHDARSEKHQDFHEIWCFSIFRKSVRKIQVSLKSDKNNGYLNARTNIHFWSYLAHFFLEWEMFHGIVVQKIRTHNLYPITFCRKACRLCENVEKILWNRAGHRLQYGVCALHAGYLNLQTHVQNMYYLLLFHCNNTCTNASVFLLFQDTKCRGRFV